MTKRKRNNSAAGKVNASELLDQANLIDKSMPESLAAEAAVLGSMLVDPEKISSVVDKLKSDDFYHHEHQIIYDAVVTLYERNKGQGLDAILLRDELQKKKKLEEVGGVDYLKKILESVASSANVEYYSGIVQDKALLRQIIAASTEILNDAYNGTGEVKEQLDKAEQRIFTVTNKKMTGAAAPLKELVQEVYELIEKRDGALVTGLPTGYDELDGMTCGLQKGEMLIVAGRPSMGKTAFALNVAENVGIVKQKPVAIFSLEMGRQQLAERILCSRSKMDSQRVRRGLLGTDDYEELVRTCGMLSEAPIYIDDTPGLTPLQIRAKARRLKSQYDIELMLVDYLQLMSAGSGKNESRQQEITEISRQLKAIARELDIPIIVLSQLNRAAENREDHKPRMSDLRESGSIEQDADVIMLLHRDDYYHRHDPEYQPTKTAQVIIAKQRNGPTGVVELMFLEEHTRFENLAQNYVEEPF